MTAADAIHGVLIRYRINIIVKDPSGEIRLEGFNDLGLALFEGKPADELVKLKVGLFIRRVQPPG